MGDDNKTSLKLNFDSKVRLEFRGATTTSDAGQLACRELDDALGLTESGDDFPKEKGVPSYPLFTLNIYAFVH